jgi:S-DNA-T family DNA segregation ATPase FtsK/SpoIIIE
LVESDRLRREIAGGAALLLAFLTSWSLGRGEHDGRVIEWCGHALREAFGRGASLVPVFLILIAVRAFRNLPGPVLLPRHYLGGFVFAAGVSGLLELAADTAGAGGGRFGMAITTLLTGAIGELGSGLVLFVAGCFAVFLLAGTDLLTFWRDLKDLWPRRPFAVEEASLAPLTPAPEKGALATAAPLAPAPPVINLPAKETKDAKEKTASRSTDMPKIVAPTGEPLPLPELEKLTNYDGVKLDTGDLEAKARRIEDTLVSFKVDARVREINPGPAVTQFTLEPGPGIKVRRITELQNDLALALAAPSIRIEAPIPGMARVGVEIPNEQIATVGLRETLESISFQRTKAKLPVPLGRDVNGRYIVGDLTKMPHLLIAGATGSGKSVCLNGIISTFLLTRRPEDLKMLMIDPKMVELTGYNGVPHLQCPVVTEMDKVVGALRLVLREMERRYTLFSKTGVRNLDGYRLKVADEPGAERLPYLVVIIDELADLMMTAPEEVETLLVRLAQMARATGIHLIIATQRPSVDVLTGLIKANVPARIAFAVTSLTDSRVVLDLPGAERLLGRGDMLFLPPDAAKPVRIQGAFIEDKDLQYLVQHWHAVAPVPHYAKEWLELPSSNAPDEEADDDPLMDQAMEIVRQQGTASASMLQRRLRIGYNRAARLIERMEDEGLIGPADGIKGRPVLTGGVE